MGKGLKHRMAFAACAAAALLAGCTTLKGGSAQTIALDVTPVDADCTGWHDGQLVGIYYPTFHTMRVGPGKNELTLLCSSYGYEDALVQVKPEESKWYLTGARHKYDRAVVIVMDKLSKADR